MNYLKGEIKTTQSVSDEEIKFIFDSLYRHYYDGVGESYDDYFLGNFRKREYALLFSINGMIKGFSLQEVIPITVDDKAVLVLWAGDIMIDPEYWGKNDYRYQLSALCRKLHQENPNKLIYRLTTPKGYKTFKIVPKLFQQYYPSPEHNYYPEFEAKVIDKILLSKYATDVYDQEKKILVPKEDAHRLADNFAQITADKLTDPLIKFFYERNPDYAKGNEIPVISQITPENLKPQKRYKSQLLQAQ